MLESLHRSDSDREALEWVGFRLRNVKLQSKVCLAVLDWHRQELASWKTSSFTRQLSFSTTS